MGRRRQHHLGHDPQRQVSSGGTSYDDDNIVWGTSDDDNIVWGTEADLDNIVWGTSTGMLGAR